MLNNQKIQGSIKKSDKCAEAEFMMYQEMISKLQEKIEIYKKCYYTLKSAGTHDELTRDYLIKWTHTEHLVSLLDDVFYGTCEKAVKIEDLVFAQVD